VCDLILAGQARGEVDRAVDPDVVARVPVGIYRALVRERSWDPEADGGGYVATAQAIAGGTSRRGLSEQEEDAHA
jgi:hypothetical protein